jgi:hypothetical protein
VSKLLKSQKNSKKQGDVGLAMAISWFSIQGHTVSIPLTDSQDYDLVVEIDGKLNRVQIKTTYHKREGKNGFILNLRVNGGNRSGNSTKHFDKSNVEYVFAVTEEGTMYLIPSEVIDAKSMIILNEKYSEFIVR